MSAEVSDDGTPWAELEIWASAVIARAGDEALVLAARHSDFEGFQVEFLSEMVNVHGHSPEEAAALFEALMDELRFWRARQLH